MSAPLSPPSYDDVNAAWPDTPVITGKAALAAANRLWKAFEKREGVRRKKFSRVRRTWASTDRTRNTLHAGWRRMVHDVSHYMLGDINPLARPHGPVHADLELRMIRYVLAKGWLEPKPVKAKPDPVQLRYARVLAGIERWEAKQRRAENALRKLVQQRRYYERKGLGNVAETGH